MPHANATDGPGICALPGGLGVHPGGNDRAETEPAPSPPGTGTVASVSRRQNGHHLPALSLAGRSFRPTVRKAEVPGGGGLSFDRGYARGAGP